MENLDTPGKRLLYFIEAYLKTNRNAFGLAVGLSKKMIYNYVDGVTPLTYENLVRIINVYPELNAEWIMEGKEPMILDNPEKTLHPDTIRHLRDEIKAKDALIAELNNIISEYKDIIKAKDVLISSNVKKS